MNWIDIKERLPEPNKQVLIVNINEFNSKQEIRLAYKYIENQYPGWYSNDACEDEVFTVTHWMYPPSFPEN